jgi:hypothetical protein
VSGLRQFEDILRTGIDVLGLLRLALWPPMTFPVLADMLTEGEGVFWCVLVELLGLMLGVEGCRDADGDEL